MTEIGIGKLFEFTLKVLKKARFPFFSNKFSKKTYTQHQHLALLVLKTFLKADYRKICSVVEGLEASFSVLNLPQVPHFTTLQKFFCRLAGRWLEILISRILHQFESIQYLAIDATGLECDRTSKYYQMRVGESKWVSNFLKLSVLFDVKRRLPVAVCCHNRQRHDNKDFLPLMKRVSCNVEYFVADKAYDAEANLSFLREHGIKAIIPLRRGLTPRTKLRKRSLKAWAANPGLEKQYHQRSLVESFFSALKRKLGEEISSRLWYLQRREATLKVVVYSMLRRLEAALFWSISTAPLLQPGIRKHWLRKKQG